MQRHLTKEFSAGHGAAPGRSLASTLRADAYRLYGSGSVVSIARGVLFNRCFRPVATLRLCQHAAGSRPGRLTLPLCKVLHRLASWVAGMDLSWRADIGPGFHIVHGWGLVISPGARIGRNATVFHGVTIGRLERLSASGRRAPEYPTIGDDVWVGPHAIIVGGITVGSGSRIAGGAFVTREVPARTLVGGNPAVILKVDCAPDVAHRVPLGD
jgi:serine O-acetyltransferase